MKPLPMFAGLVIAVLSAVALLVFPVEVALLPAFIGLVLGLVLFGVGFFWRAHQHKLEVSSVMRQYGKNNHFQWVGTLAADDTLPPSITLFRRGTERRCEDAVAVEVHGRTGLLFLLRYWIPPRGRDDVGHWQDRITVFLPSALPGQADFQIRAESMFMKIFGLFKKGSIRLPQTPAGAKFARVYRLWGDNRAALQDFFNEQRLAWFAEHPGLYVECSRGDLALCYERGPADKWRVGWDRSFRAVAEWVPEKLTGLLEAADQLLSDGSKAATGQFSNPESKALGGRND